VQHTEVVVDNRPILLVDSDTTAVLANQYLPPGWGCLPYDPTAQTNLGSATHAVIWGRNDEGGRTWAQAVAESLSIPFHVVTLRNLPEHWHLGDNLPAGRSRAMLTKYLVGAVEWCQAARTPGGKPGTRAPLAASASQKPPQTTAAAVLPTGAHTPQDNVDLPYIRSGARGDGSVKPIMQNAAMLLAANPHRWDLRFNEFSHRTCLGRDPITDHDILQMSQWVQQSGVHASVSTIGEAINAVAGNQKFHPVREYLDPLVWDGIPRIDMLFIDHAGTPDTPLTRAVTSRWLIQAVARIYQPGCQADTTLVLEGNQGLRKSSFFRELFGDQWFTDHLPDLTSKDALIQLRGVWCVEIAELATLGRADIKKINQFLTSRVDRYRDPYGRVVADFPRTCVFSGTVNPGAGGYLKDETGARRFWPVTVQDQIDIGIIYHNRDMIWAEALHRYRAHEAWYLGEESLSQAATAAALDRFASDPWQSAVDSFLLGKSQVTVEDIFRDALKVEDLGKWSQMDMNRVARCLAFSGWVRVSRGPRKWVYVPEGSEPPQSAML
jgi:hypothetical protein